MTYLERNQELIREMGGQNLRFQRGAVIGEGGSVRFVVIGSYQSPSLESRLYLGLKEYLDPRDTPFFLLYRIEFELAVMQRIAQELPHLEPKLPLCYARLLGKNGQPLGIVMEDLSQGKRFQVRRTLPPSEIEGIFIKNSLDPADTAGMAVEVNGRRRLMDFYPIFRTINKDIQRSMLGLTETKSDLDRCTLQVDYDL